MHLLLRFVLCICRFLSVVTFLKRAAPFIAARSEFALSPAARPRHAMDLPDSVGEYTRKRISKCAVAAEAFAANELTKSTVTREGFTFVMSSSLRESNLTPVQAQSKLDDFLRAPQQNESFAELMERKQMFYALGAPAGGVPFYSCEQQNSRNKRIRAYMPSNLGDQ